MSKDVDAVIAALRTVLEEVERQTRADSFQIHIVNKWIRQLPAAWWGRWNRLLLEPRWAGSPIAYRDPVLTHLRSTLAYLETNRENIVTKPPWWPFGRAAGPAAVEGQEDTVKKVPIAEKPHQRERVDVTTPKPKWLN
jgi:hypothetical protein